MQLTTIKSGFTLIELLIVIVIMGILVAIITTNLYGARQRGNDSQKKSNLKELKTALQLYFVDYKQYPASSGAGTRMNGCGSTGQQACPVCPSADFASGGSDGCARVYANHLEMNTSGSFSNIRYTQCAGGDDFRIKVALSNPSDRDIADSQARCPATPNCSITYTSKDYVLCVN